MTKIEGIALFFILMVGVNAETADPWWVPHLLVILACLVIVIAAHLDALKGEKAPVKGGFNRG